MNKEKVLFLLSRLPYPLTKGDRLRAYHQIRILSRKYEIYLVCFVEDESELHHVRHLNMYCREIKPVILRRKRSYSNLSKGIFSSKPFQVLYYQSPDMKKTLGNLLNRHQFDCVLVQLIRMAEYTRGLECPKILDLVDAVSLGLQRRLGLKIGLSWPAVYSEWKRVSSYEREIVTLFDRVIISSAFDEEYLGFCNIEVIDNGVDTGYFCPRKTSEGLNLIFTGNMSYYPNIDAVKHFCKDIFPQILLQVPTVRFYIVGTNPAREVKKLASRHVVVTGFVKDVREYLRRATVCMAPMRVGAGVQFKILEAMASGIPVVATSIANAGIKAVDGKEILLTDDDAEFASSVVRLLSNRRMRERLVANALKLVRNRFTWESIVKKFDYIIRQVVL